MPLLKKGRCAGLLFSLSLYLGLSSCAHAHAQEERFPPVPEGNGKQLFVTVCSQCHTLKSTLIMRDGQQGWEDTVNRMVLYGAQLSPPEADTITRYLVTQLGPGSARPERSHWSPYRPTPRRIGKYKPRHHSARGPG